MPSKDLCCSSNKSDADSNIDCASTSSHEEIMQTYELSSPTLSNNEISDLLTTEYNKCIHLFSQQKLGPVDFCFDT